MKTSEQKLTFLILDLGLDILDRIRRLNFERDGLARQRFHEDLHLGETPRSLFTLQTPETEYENL